MFALLLASGVCDCVCSSVRGCMAWPCRSARAGRWVGAGLLAAVMLTTAGFDPVGCRAAHGATIVIDDFSSPSPAAMFSLSGSGATSMLVKQTGDDIVGGERDVLLELLGGGSASLLVGDDYLDMNSGGAAGAVLSLQYDGMGAGDNDTAAGLLNNGGLAIDLSDGGENHLFQLDFLMLDAGPGADAIDLVIEVSSANGTASFMGQIDESAGPSSYLIDFSQFQINGSFSWSEVTGIDFVLNAGGQAAVDFVLDSLTVTVPEPTGMLLALPGLVVAAGLGYRNRQRPPTSLC